MTSGMLQIDWKLEQLERLHSENTTPPPHTHTRLPMITIDSYRIPTIQSQSYVVRGYNYKSMNLAKPGTYVNK